jgi:hypothetical protein
MGDRREKTVWTTKCCFPSQQPLVQNSRPVTPFPPNARGCYLVARQREERKMGPLEKLIYWAIPVLTIVITLLVAMWRFRHAGPARITRAWIDLHGPAFWILASVMLAISLARGHLDEVFGILLAWMIGFPLMQLIIVRPLLWLAGEDPAAALPSIPARKGTRPDPDLSLYGDGSDPAMMPHNLRNLGKLNGRW